MSELSMEAGAAEQQSQRRWERVEARHFGGPFGATAMMVLLPLLTIYLWICIHRHDGSLVLPTAAMLADVPLPSVHAVLYLVGWLAFQIVLELTLPGRVVEGLPQRDGLRLEYKLNGFLSLWVSLAVLAAAWGAGMVTGTGVLAALGPLLTSSIAFAFALSLFLYLYGFRSSRVEQRSGKRVYDYFMGSALNPRLGRFDLKLFFESKIGMTTWIAITLAMAAAQWERNGSVSVAMVLVCVFQLLYVADFYFFEEAMLSTWDINHENYGFMLAFGFVVWMPFNFSLQAQYLVYHATTLPMWSIAALVILNLAGYYVFRSSNLQKHRFRTDPDAMIWGEKARFIQTERGTKLLTSGWWGLARHSNYLGDLMMALAWCLPAGFDHITPYFYFIYFAPLLIDRERRDHHHCHEKYGKDWDTYCQRVKYRIVPGLY